MKSDWRTYIAGMKKLSEAEQAEFLDLLLRAERQGKWNGFTAGVLIGLGLAMGALLLGLATR